MGTSKFQLEGYHAIMADSSAPASAPGESGLQEYLFKVIVIGEPSVGKTSTIKRYVDDVFSNRYKATIGVDFALKMVEVDSNTLVRIQLWDIAGQERFGSMTRVYYRDADAAVVMFDLTAQRTFDAIAKWKADVDDKVLLASGEPVPCLLLGNKSDLPGRAVADADVEAFCRQAGFMGYHAVSAKTAEHVDDAMMHLLRYMLSTSPAPERPEEADSFRLGDDDGPQEKGSKCCD